MKSRSLLLQKPRSWTFDKVLSEETSELASKGKGVLFLNQFKYQR